MVKSKKSSPHLTLIKPSNSNSHQKTVENFKTLLDEATSDEKINELGNQIASLKEHNTADYIALILNTIPQYIIDSLEYNKTLKIKRIKVILSLVENTDINNEIIQYNLIKTASSFKSHPSILKKIAALSEEKMKQILKTPGSMRTIVDAKPDLINGMRTLLPHTKIDITLYFTFMQQIHKYHASVPSIRRSA